MIEPPSSDKGPIRRGRRIDQFYAEAGCKCGFGKRAVQGPRTKTLHIKSPTVFETGSVPSAIPWWDAGTISATMESSSAITTRAKSQPAQPPHERCSRLRARHEGHRHGQSDCVAACQNDLPLPDVVAEPSTQVMSFLHHSGRGGNCAKENSIVPSTCLELAGRRRCRPIFILASPEITALLQKQKACFGARATEYDKWWEKNSRYNLRPGRNAMGGRKLEG
jgi:hypothetical protein